MGELALIQTKDLLSPGDLEVLKASKFKGFSDSEISYARTVCSHLQLNPILNQIHFVKRKDNDAGTFVITVQVGIDGFRLAAERTGKYAGSDDPVFKFKNANDKYPESATVTVYKMMEGVRCPFTATARWAEYFPGDSSKMSFMWKKMPTSQLAKCAEALALRKGFPAELSALRTDEEMAQADREPPKSKASALNARGKFVAPSEEPEDAQILGEENHEQESQGENRVPICCEQEMKVSKFADKDTGKFPYYCVVCKKKNLSNN